MARHATAPSVSGANGRLGPLTTRMLLTGAATSSVKSEAPRPIGICRTRSRFVHNVWIDSCRRSLRKGASAGSTSETNTSVPM